jgi:toxin FitB
VSFLLDTCFVSELTRPQPDPGLIRWLEEQDEAELFLSEVTVGELEKGLHQLRDSKRKQRLRELVENEVIERFAERTVPTDERVWRRWGSLSGAAARAGRPLPVLDALVAAVAQVHGLTVVTRNTTDFERCDVPVVNPWSDAGG